jgi:hypothetical protein
MSSGWPACSASSLYTSQDTLWALNMYSKRVDAFDEDDFNAGMLLAAQGAVALAESQATAQWQNAALNRTIIGQAEGILMERRLRCCHRCCQPRG